MSINSKMVDNLKHISLRQLTPKDTLYIQKTFKGFSYNYLCRFVEIRRGVVVGKILDVDKSYGDIYYESGEEITTRADKCYLWGRFPEDQKTHRWAFCHWFKDLDTPL